MIRLSRQSEPPTGETTPARECACDRRLERDLRLLARFVEVFCNGHTDRRERRPVRLKFYDVEAIHRKPLMLCASCEKLLAHAIVKRTHCPLSPKPACKKCPQHCYAPKYRDQMRSVMRYAGRRLVLSGRLDYLYHLFF